MVIDMSMKRFWDKYYEQDKNGLVDDIEILINNKINSIREDMGMFFWKRDGKQFVKYCKEEHGINNFKLLIERADELNVPDHPIEDMELSAQTFLDCVACLGKAKVKELIKGVE